VTASVSSRSVEHAIPGDYQLQALRQGRALQRAWHRARLDLVSCVLPPRPGGLLLDAAAGSGILTWRFGTRGLVSTDLRVSACAAIRAHTAGAPAVAALLDALPFRDGVFTQLYLLEALEHLDPEEGIRALGELRRVAAPGAECLITTPNDRSLWPTIERLLDRWGLTPPMEGAQHVSKYDRRSLARTAAASGWTVRRLGTFNLVAPVAGTLVPAAGRWITSAEAAALRAAGPLLFAVCRRDP
jgi:ubiquinone/menaquinone biosynthesis C-methylase UbiE